MMESIGTNCTKGNISNLMTWDHAAAGVDYLTCAIPLDVGDRVTGASIRANLGDAIANLLTGELVELDMSNGNVVSKSNTVGNTSSSGYQAVTLTGVTATSVGSGKLLLLRISTASDTTTKKVIGAEITYGGLDGSEQFIWSC